PRPGPRRRLPSFPTRRSSDLPRLDCYGTVDELNAVIGLVIEALSASAAGPHLVPILRRVQNELFNLGCELATPDAEQRAKLPRIDRKSTRLNSSHVSISYAVF